MCGPRWSGLTTHIPGRKKEKKRKEKEKERKNSEKNLSY
jgi:hypothetical protein